MTKRIISHQLEDKSRSKFGLLISQEWVFRNKEKDYGIDGEVEIFDNQGNATGLIFFVQLKATEISDKKLGSAIRISIDKIKYYKKLELPVLIILYVNSKNRFYYKWAHEIDLFYAKKGAKTFMIKMTNEWNDETSKKLHLDLIKRHKIEQGELKLPLKIKILVETDEIKGISKSEIIAKLTNFFLEYSWILSVTKDNNEMLANVVLDSNKLVVSLFGLAECTFHSLEKRIEEDFFIGIGKDVLLGLSVTFLQKGYIDYCGRLIFEGKLEDRLLEKKEIAHILLPALLNGSYFEKVLDTIENKLNRDNYKILDIIILSSILFINRSLSQNRVERVERFLKTHIEKAYKKNDSIGIGIAHYNLGNYSRNRHLLKKSFYHYNKARKYANLYINQHYFFSELGGVLYLLEKFTCSASAYKKSLELGAPPEIMPLYADAKMYSGCYEDAQNLFNDYFKIENDSHAEWLLKKHCLEIVLDTLKISNQKRNANEAVKFADISKIENNENLMDLLKKALYQDLLCGLAWFNIGIEFNKKNQYQDACIAFTMCGLVQ
ncbi:MAG: DUF4365 domain-containing protein, partial [Chrysiogenia bacterium]